MQCHGLGLGTVSGQEPALHTGSRQCQEHIQEAKEGIIPLCSAWSLSNSWCPEIHSNRNYSLTLSYWGI